MLIGVLGDSHQQIEEIDKCIKRLKNVNLIIHTGDMVNDCNYIANKLNIPTIGVLGNCDPYGDGKDEILYEVNNIKIFICHGHRYGVKRSLDKLVKRGKVLGANIVIFGHTHIPIYKESEGMHILNPGSIAFPRGFSKKSIGIIEISERITIKHVDI